MPRPRTRIRRLAWPVVWLLQLGLWLLLVSKLERDEIYAGLAAAALATLAAGWLDAVHFARFRPSLAALASGWRIPWYILSDTVAIFLGLARQLFTSEGAPSALRAVAFDLGGDDAQSAARQALVITYGTITPNSIVLGLVREQKLLLYHQILPGELPPTIRELGARP
jgi:hypothetical protein